MAKNNKGFSLIEIIIAIAVLTLLLTPIIEQFAQTMRTSRLAKEQQYINEEAIYALEEAQVASNEDLDAIYSKLSVDEGLPYSSSTDAVTCDIIDVTNGNTIASVTYNVDTYQIQNLEMGARNTLYNKTVKIDDLSTVVRGVKNPTDTSKGYNIAYNLTNGDLSALSEDFELTNEGCAVQYDTNGNPVKIVCSPTDYIGNPNNTNLGNMQNLDLNTVAMINGTSATFDSQAEVALYALALEKLKEIDYESWQQAIFHTSDDNVLNQYSYSNAVKKVTKIYIDEVKDSSNKDCFLVNVDVYYISQFSLTVKDSETDVSTTHNFTEDLKYNVFSQTFYTENCPDIYFEYQPYIVDASSSAITYASDDYILMDNNVDGVKLYLYKPFSDALNVSNGMTEADYNQGTYVYTTSFADAATRADETALATFNANNAVKIHMTDINQSSKDVMIYTNLDTTPGLQFYCDKDLYSGAVYDEMVSDNATYSHLTVKDPFNSANIKSISDDVRYDDRLKTVTVTMAPVSDNGNTVKLTGAKGEK